MTFSNSSYREFCKIHDTNGGRRSVLVPLLVQSERALQFQYCHKLDLGLWVDHIVAVFYIS